MDSATFTRTHWILPAVLALAPAGLFAQGNASAEPGRESLEAVQAAQQAHLETAEVSADAGDGQRDAEEAQERTEEGPRVISGMSILGNQEAPTSLVIVPWKGSEIGDSISISTLLDDSRQPVDKEVFIRALRYYEIRSETAP